MDPSRIRLARKAAKMTQAELAECVDLNRATISKYETGDIEPSVEMLGYIANALDCDIEYLLGYNADMRTTPETKALISAMRRGDARTIENLMGLEPGTILDFVPQAQKMEQNCIHKNNFDHEENGDIADTTQINFNATQDSELTRLSRKIYDKTASEEEIQEFARLILHGMDISKVVINNMQDTGTNSIGVSQFDVSNILLNRDHNLNRIIYLLNQLNDDGQLKAIERIEELTEIPKYQRQQEPQNAAEGTDTSLTTNAPTESEGGQYVEKK